MASLVEAEFNIVNLCCSSRKFWLLDRICSPDMLPVLGEKVVKGQQLFLVFLQASRVSGR